MDLLQNNTSRLVISWKVLLFSILILIIGLKITYIEPLNGIVFLLFFSLLLSSLLSPNATLCLLIVLGCTIFQFGLIFRFYSHGSYSYFSNYVFLIYSLFLFLIKLFNDINHHTPLQTIKILYKNKYAVFYLLFFSYLLLKGVIEFLIYDTNLISVLKHMNIYFIYGFYFYLLLMLYGKLDLKKVVRFLFILGVIGVIIRIILFYSPIKNPLPYLKNIGVIEGKSTLPTFFHTKLTTITDGAPINTFYHARIEWAYTDLFGLLFFISLFSFLTTSNKKQMLLYVVLSALFFLGIAYSFQKLIIISWMFALFISLALWGWQQKKVILSLLILLLFCTSIIWVLNTIKGKEMISVMYNQISQKLYSNVSGSRISEIKQIPAVLPKHLFFGIPFHNLGPFRYGAITGLIAMITHIGIIGVLLYLVPFFYFIVASLKKLMAMSVGQTISKEQLLNWGLFAFIIYLLPQLVFYNYLFFARFVFLICFTFFISSILNPLPFWEKESGLSIV